MQRLARIIGGVTAAGLAMLGVAASVRAGDCRDMTACETRLAVGGPTIKIYANAPLDRPQPDIRRALIVVHGTDGNAEDYFRVGLKAAAASSRDSETIVVAPAFVELQASAPPRASELVWDRTLDWRAGDLSTAKTTPRVSSFAVMDRLLDMLGDRARFPALRAVTIAGHSAGGQYVQRYAIARDDDAPFSHLTIRYLAANPSSYLYLDAFRPDGAGGFAVPPPSGCDTNRFKYGFERRNAYFSRDSTDVMVERYRARDVIYLLGARDVDPNDRHLSRHCAAMAQGPYRFARGTNFMAYLDARHAPHSHRLVVVPNVGHAAARMFLSSAGLTALFP